MSPRSALQSLPMSAVEEAPLALAGPSAPVSRAGKSDDASARTTVARRVSATATSLADCGRRLRSGRLVSFPTETVYGLGCHALDPAAVRRVFDAKDRPLSDPLIVHVTRIEDALGLWAASSPPAQDNFENVLQRQRRAIEGRALSTLAASFFPGPLTLVARARTSVPGILMAGTDYVGCRSPSHPVARALIDAAGIPIAAPSANKFGHVSPTAPDHVLDDLGREDVWVVDPGMGVDGVVIEGGMEQNSGAICRVGVESTVAKIEMCDDLPPSDLVAGRITVLRHGAVSSRSIREVLEEAGLSCHFSVKDSFAYTPEGTSSVAPGQTVRHYSPSMPCFLVGLSRQRGLSDSGEGLASEEERAVLSRAVIVDYGNRLAGYQQHALAYRDLSPMGDPTAAASIVFEVLRWSEAVEGAARVFVPELALGNDLGGGEGQDGGALVLALKDKLTRAASAVVVDVFC